MDWPIRSSALTPTLTGLRRTIHDAGEDIYEEYILSGLDAVEYFALKIREAKEKTKTPLEDHADPTLKDLTVNYMTPTSFKTFTEKTSPIGVELFDESELSKTFHVLVVEDSKAISIDSTAALIGPPLADLSATFFFFSKA